MIIVNRPNETTISGSVNGIAFSVTYDEQKYQLMLELQQKAESVDTMAAMHAIIEEFTPLTKESYKELVQTASPYIFANKHSGKFYLRFGEVISSKPLPKVFADKIMKSLEKGIDIMPLVKCWARFLRPVKGRPEYTEERGKLFAEYISATYTDSVKASELMKSEGFSSDVANAHATTTQVAITKEGLLVCYKASRELTHKFVKNTEQDGGVRQVKRYDYVVDEETGETTDQLPEDVTERIFEPPIMGQGGDAFLCGEKLGHTMKVGKVIELPNWDMVDCNNAVAGRKGLHVGGLKYIQGYMEQEGNVTHNIFVDPMDIGAIVGLGYGNDGAMRVRRYFIFSTFAGANKSIYHSSSYAALNDQDYAKLVQESVEATKMKQSEMDKLLAEEKDLIPAAPLSAGSVLGN